MAAVSKTKKIVDFYLPELLNHFRSMSEHRFSPINFSIIKKIILSVINASDRMERIDQLKNSPSLTPFFQFLQQILEMAEKEEVKISQLIANIESDSEKLYNLFTQILPAHVDLNAMETELQTIGITIDLNYLKKTYLSKTEEKVTVAPKPVITKTETPKPAKKPIPTEFGKVDDMIGFLNARGKKTSEKKEPVPFDEVIDMTAAAVKQVFGKKVAPKIDNETMIAFREEVSSYSKMIEDSLSRLRRQNDRSALRDIQQSSRALITASKLLKFKVLTDTCQSMMTVYTEAIGKELAATSELIDLTGETMHALKTFAETQQLTEENFLALSRQFSQFKFGSAVPTPSKEIEKTQSEVQSKTEEKPKVIEKTKTEEKPVVAVESKSDEKQTAGDLSWMDSMQNVISQNFPKTSAMTTEIPEPVKETPKIETKEEEHETTVKLDLPPETPKTVPIVRKKPATPTEQNVLEPEKLLDMMASHDPDVDLTQMKMPSFIEKMSVEPEDIVATAAPKTKKKKSVTKTEKTVIKEAPKVSETQEIKKAEKTEVKSPIQSEPTESDGLLREMFTEMDAEILEIFEQEAGSYFKMFDKSIEKLRTNLKDDNAIKDLERASHSLKSSSRMLGFEKISGLAACIELITERFFENEIVLDASMLQLLYDIVIALKQLFNRAAVDALSIAERLVALERTLSTPDIFMRNLPSLKAGASKPVTEKAVKTPETPIPEKNEVKEVKEEDQESGKDYFASTGVDEEIVQIFKEEAGTYIKSISNAVVSLNKDINNLTVMRDIEKSAHSLRSSAKMLGFLKISNLARPIEVLAERINKGKAQIDPGMIALFDESSTVLKTLVAGTDVPVDDVLDRLSAAEKQPVSTADKPIKKESEAVVKSKKIKKEPKTSPKAFTDIQLDSDPILKRLVTGENELLSEMAESSHSLK
ncbi:Hpt domain-containing protein [bacterium]|nr:Hpt domain-containing protein [bacterium]